MDENILDSVNNYYSKKVQQHGRTPHGVDWNSLDSQELRFLELCDVIDEDSNFSLLDFGCGYGALLDYLGRTKKDFQYTGYDISHEMIAEAANAHKKNENVSWCTDQLTGQYDYTIASGVFNVRLNTEKSRWEEYIKRTLATIHEHSKKGFAFNMLTSYSDAEYMQDYLYYASPTYFFDYCKQHYSKHVTLLHDYPLYEFTIIVRK